jgi:hypothetical protein
MELESVGWATGMRAYSNANCSVGPDREIYQGNMNQQQFLGILRIVLPSVMAFVVAKGWIAEGQVADLSTAIVTIAAAAWSVFVHTQKNAVAVVVAIPSTETKVEEGKMTIVLHDEVLAEAAASNATPYSRK